MTSLRVRTGNYLTGLIIYVAMSTNRSRSFLIIHRDNNYSLIADSQNRKRRTLCARVDESLRLESSYRYLFWETGKQEKRVKRHCGYDTIVP